MKRSRLEGRCRTLHKSFKRNVACMENVTKFGEQIS